LGESELPIASAGALKCADVLNDPTLLVVGLLEEKAVVLDLRNYRRGSSAEQNVNGKQ
jgi:hypothetical protein